MKSFFTLLFAILVLATGSAHASSISSDGTKLLIEERGNGYTCVTSVYDLSNGSKIVSFENYSVDSCGDHPSFSPDGRYLAVNVDNDIVVYDFKTKDIVFRMSSYLDVSTLRFSPDGKHLAIATRDFVTIEEFISRKTRQFIKVNIPAYTISDLTFTSNQTVLVRDRFERDFLAFDIVSGESAGKFRVDSSNTWISDDSQYIWTSESVYHSKYGERYDKLSRDNRYPVLSGNAKFLVTSSFADSQLLRVYQWPQLKEVARINSLDGGKLVSNDGKMLFTYSRHHITAWDLQTGEKLWNKSLEASIRLSPDSSTLVTVGSWSIDIWDARTGALKFKAR